MDQSAWRVGLECRAVSSFLLSLTLWSGAAALIIEWQRTRRTRNTLTQHHDATLKQARLEK